MGFLHEIVEKVDNFKTHIGNLKAKSPIYPEVYTEKVKDVFWVSTLVHFWYNDVLFSRHHVESGHLNKDCTEESILIRLHKMAKLCKEKAIPCKFDDVVSAKPQ